MTGLFTHKTRRFLRIAVIHINGNGIGRDSLNQTG
ncbi:hypothetical protein ASD8599_00513 [Ascidiaceihabitans donghaensis]|uniref:Uncharacterized protein n=1 Tax=Ascidiaceihabitans donghaensis TaxID=1510460 RepID=A0A2R8B9M1_9RHOB|nr:hypothetical protein ASD8599_00513 [Ascidiaceihabitans donghaensis]